MIELLAQSTARDTTSHSARALVTIDLGNGEVKAAVRMPGTAGWISTKFDSTVRVARENESNSIRLATDGGFIFYAVGEKSSTSERDRTGRTKEGKVENARALLIHALRQVIEPKHGATIHADVIFTSPSNAAYRQRIIDELQGTHSVMVPAAETDLDAQDLYFSANIHNAFGQLEGLRAVHLLSAEIKGNAYLIDVGHRTILVTKVNGKGAIQDKDRRLFDDRGVAFIAEEINRRELLHPAMCFSPLDVIAAMFDRKQKKAVQSAIAPVLEEVLSEVEAALSDDGAARYVIGGGAALPGAAKYLKAQAVENAQWASLHGLAAVADKVIAAEQRRAR